MTETATSVTARFQLRELLEKHRIGQSDFARKANLSFATVNRLCTNGTAQVSLETLDKVIAALRKAGIKASVADVISIEPDKKGR